MPFHKSGKVIGILTDEDGLSIVIDRDGAQHVENITLDDEMLALVHQKIVERWQSAYHQKQLAKRMGLSLSRNPQSKNQ